MARGAGRSGKAKAGAAETGTAAGGEQPAALAPALDDGRRPQGRRTEEKLLDAGMQVLAERGYHAARVDDIVRVAKVSHGTFYLYFANKEDLFRSLATTCADDMSHLAASLGPVGPDTDGVDELERWLGAFVASYRRYGVVIRAWMEDQVTDRELARLGARAFSSIAGSLVTRLVEARPEVTDRAELEAAALLAMIERFTYYVTSRDLDVADEQVVGTLAVLAHRGFFLAA